MAFLQWRRFAFFDKEAARDPAGGAGAFDGLAALNVSVCACGRGQMLFGDFEGNIHFLNRNLQLSSFKAYELRVSHLYQLKQHNLFVSVGEDEQGINPMVKVWNMDKRDKTGIPLCCRIFRAIPSNKPTEVTCLAIHEGLNYMGIGFTDGSVVLIKGDITRDRHSKTQVVHESTYPITGLAFRQVGKVMHLFVVTTDNVQSYILQAKIERHVLDPHGCALRCSTLSDLSQDNQFIVARDDCVYMYQPEERGPCFAFEGEKRLVCWFRGYLVVVSKDSKSMPRSSGSGLDRQAMDMHMVTVYDLENKLIAYSAPFPHVVDVLVEWGSLFVLTGDNKLVALHEKDTQTKLEMLFKKNLYVLAISVAKTQHLDTDGLAEIFRQYGDHLYSKGDHDGAIQQYIRTIGKLEPSYVIRKFLDAQRIHNLTAYLQALHRQSRANKDHTTLLLNCYTKLKDSSKLEEFIKTSEVAFDVETAIKVLRQAGYYDHALYLAEKDAQHEWYLKIQLEDIKDCHKALVYIAKLPFEQAESNLKKYGKTLVQYAPVETTGLLKVLCTGYRPRADPHSGDGDTSAFAAETEKANPEEFIHIYANNREQLKAFLEHMAEVQPRCSQGVNDTLLELYLCDWMHETDPQKKKNLENATMALLTSGAFNSNFDKALIMCQMNNFKDGILFLYEKAQLYQQIVRFHMESDDYQRVIEACKRYSDRESCLWEQALGYFARKEENCRPFITEVLQHIDQNNLMPPLLVVQTLAHNSTATLAVIKDYIIRRLQSECEQIAEDEQYVRGYREETEKIRGHIEELRTSAKIFQVTKCSVCKHPLELPSVHFLCEHAYHQHCFEGYAESDAECPACLPENRKLQERIRAQEHSRDLHETFHHELQHSSDGFSVVAKYFGRGVFNKITLVTDSTAGGRRVPVGGDPVLQRELLLMPQTGRML
ncbi:LOW QUALITY PROTEIN: vacuolar protein sorting-associated protein 11 homolog [Lethenteron reissneri]|uniref:LOW QUALITY PROTEIN: vacuolar protein sorting-associated protein 11 homolog n=1 Tax=Lethenteron reissneri TaxID=7753 RepID=UPI002AB63EDF|nr:LOW QUALITY PROTEIN: vacuolar protein sorting-associated protein 11 homolog [Lethenteron reissneri]